jgi:hypothetical protein
MAADEEKNRQNQQAGASHLDQKNAPDGISSLPDTFVRRGKRKQRDPFG